MRALASTVLVFEAIVVFLAIPVALSLTDASTGPGLLDLRRAGRRCAWSPPGCSAVHGATAWDRCCRWPSSPVA